jgi:uncharacterized protein
VKNRMSNKQKEDFNSLVQDIVDNKRFNKLNKELHHGITRYEHSMRVAKWTYKICNMLNLEKKDDVTRAALLHDFYINEDLVSESGASKLGEHPTVALENSKKYFEISEMQSDIIKTHMFPCNFDIPKYKESWLVSLIDKMVSTYEMLRFKSPLYAGIYALFLFEIIRLPR